MRAEDRERIQIEVVSRVVEEYAIKAKGAAEGYLETAVNDTLYHELRRLERADPAKAKGELAFYNKIRKRMQHASDKDLRRLLEQIARRFVGEVVGNFDERVYGVVTKAIPASLWLLLNAMSPTRLASLEGLRRGFAEHLQLEGATEHVKALLDRGTLVVVPTHSSNLDSILVGYAVYLMGLPPLTYGAGLNLFTNPLMSFFMNNLGAYKVDRRKSSALYKNILKEYATVSMEMGYNNLFFPGGTRSRSGKVESKIKKGLLGTTVKAYVNNLRGNKPRPNLYICPVTISYGLVLEGTTLIDDHLKATGKSRYIIEDDEFSKPKLVYDFLIKLISLDSRIVLTFSPPMDVFGNTVDIDGNSLDARGRKVDQRRYVTRNGEPVHDTQRDSQYTRELADEICTAYKKDNVVLPTNLVSWAIFNLLKKHNPEMTLYRLLHTGGEVASFTMNAVHQETERVLNLLKERTDGPRLGGELPRGDIQEIVSEALRSFGIYHAHPAARRRGDRVFHEDRNLLLYYSNRLQGYDLK